MIDFIHEKKLKKTRVVTFVVVEKNVIALQLICESLRSDRNTTLRARLLYANGAARLLIA